MVAFTSRSPNLVENDTNNSEDVYVLNRLTDEIIRVSINSNGEEADRGGSWPSISPDGNYVYFLSNASNLSPQRFDGTYHSQGFVHNLRTGKTEQATLNKNEDSSNNHALGNISNQRSFTSNGDLVFASLAADLADNDDNQVADIFIRHENSANTCTVQRDSDDMKLLSDSDFESLLKLVTEYASTSKANRKSLRRAIKQGRRNAKIRK